LKTFQKFNYFDKLSCDGKRFASLVSDVHIRRPVSVLSNLVDTAGTFTIGDLKLDEATVTPPGAPGVLNDPVGDACVIEASGGGFVAAVPPLIDGAVCGSRGNVAVIAIVVVVVVIVVVIVVVVAFVLAVAQVVSNNTYCVVQAFAAIAISDNTGAKVAPSARADSNIEWLLGSSLLHLVYGVEDCISLDFTLDLICIIIAFAELDTLVRVVRLFHGAILHEVSVMVRHPAAFATPAAPVLFIVITTLRECQCAVNTLLLGDTPRIRVALNGEGALKSGGDGKSPARSAAALVLDGEHFCWLISVVVLGSPVDGLWEVCEASASV
jgi:hypothetical protein